MTEPALPTLLPVSLLPGAIPAAVILLGAAFANAADTHVLRDRCRTLLPGGSSLAPAATGVVIAAQTLSGCLLLTSPSLLLCTLCLTGFVLSRASALRIHQPTRLSRLHLGITGHLPGPAVLFLDTLLLLSLSGTLLSTRALPLSAPALSDLAGAALVTGAALLLARRSLLTGPLIRPRPLETGSHWPSRRAGTLPGPGPVLVLLMSPDCQPCQSWLRLLRARAAMGYFYPLHVIRPIGTTPVPTDAGPDVETPAQDDETHTTLPQPVLLALAETLPCALLVHQGVIVARWTDTLPPDWMSPHPPPVQSTEARTEQPAPLRARKLRRVPGRKAAENHRYFSPGPV
ncbi:hypothetical protein [Novispirillum itersonii]|uniref:Uncharacterized protein n=1 Tax=Novispirillum itersonii TaxID=189 RepID=A0A7W9ZL44_NOVIT|nr:hypothetical protein [Novispirillum itersonii]MBB6212234.1 hypothetical protein [Novispirillum itersonii]